MKGFKGLLLVGGGRQVFVFQQGAAWLYSLMVLTFIVGVCCGILKWAEPLESDPTGFGVLWRWTCYPRRFESALPEVKLVLSAVRRRGCGLLTVTANGAALLPRHTCSFLFYPENLFLLRRPSVTVRLRVNTCQTIFPSSPLVLMVITTKVRPRRVRPIKLFQIEARPPNTPADF